MVCRQNPAASRIMGVVTGETWLDDAQVQSVLHSLFHEYPGESGTFDPGAARERVLSRFRSDVERSPGIGVQRRRTLQRVLPDVERAARDLPAERVWGLDRLRAGVLAAQQALEMRLGEIAGRRGMSLREARAEFNEFRRERLGRTARASDEDLSMLGGAPSDARTRAALRRMRDLPARRPPVRLVQRWLPVRSGGPVVEVGLSDLSNRVELRRRDGSVEAFSCPGLHVEPSAAEFDAGRLAGVFAGRRIERVEETAFATRCDQCGRFVGDGEHWCPGYGSVALVLGESVNVAPGVQVSAASPAAIAEQLDEHAGGVASRVTVVLGDTTEVMGTAVFRRGDGVVRVYDQGTRLAADGTPAAGVQRVDVDDSNALTPGSAELSCTVCRGSVCEHVAMARMALRSYVSSAGRVRPAAAAAMLDSVQEPVAAGGGRGDDAAAAPVAAGVAFREDPEAFRAAVLVGRDQGVSVLPAPFGGFAAGAQFGVEIEFSGTTPGTQGDVARRLQAAGVLDDTLVGGYHSGQRSGWRTWVLEHDSSLRNGAELVTPILQDSPQTWNRFEQVCDALAAGGAVTDHAGAHINIGVEDFTAEMAWKLSHMVRAHEDDLFRIGRTRGSQRAMAYATSQPDPGPRWEAVRSGPRQAMMNLTNVQPWARGPRIEFRFPDASHDAGVMQTQVRLCAAMTNYVREHDVPVGRHQPRGVSWRAGWARNLMDLSIDEFAHHTQGIRGLIDDLCATDAERSQTAAVWGRGSYYRPN